MSIMASSYDYSDACRHVNGTITIPNTGMVGASYNSNKMLILKISAQFINYISKINNTQIDDANAIDLVMPMYILIEYNDIYSKTFGSL